MATSIEINSSKSMKEKGSNFYMSLSDSITTWSFAHGELKTYVVNDASGGKEWLYIKDHVEFVLLHTREIQLQSWSDLMLH